MPKIQIRNLNNRLLTISDNSQTVLHSIQSHDIDWMHACGGKGRCTTCKIILVEGAENLSPVNASEEKFLASGRLKSNERLACQCHATGDLTVEVADENKFPHVTYS